MSDLSEQYKFCSAVCLLHLVNLVPPLITTMSQPSDVPPSSHAPDHSTLVEDQDTSQIPQPDLAFPSLTTDLERAGGFTNEYRQETATGLMPFKSEHEKQFPSPATPEQLPDGLKRATTKYEALKLTDPERAKDLENVFLVTWKLNDPVRDLFLCELRFLAPI